MEWYQSRIGQQNGGDPAVVIVKKIFDFGLSQPHVQSQPEYIKTLTSWLVSVLLPLYPATRWLTICLSLVLHCPACRM
jgi:hypothetical protein